MTPGRAVYAGSIAVHLALLALAAVVNGVSPAGPQRGTSSRWPWPRFPQAALALRGGGGSALLSAESSGEPGLTSPLVQGDWPDADMLPPSEEAAAASEEPSCSVALERMAALVEGAREQRSGLADGYALLQELQDEGAPVNTAVFNAFLRMAVALAEHGDAGTVDGERIVARLEREGLSPDQDTFLQMMLLIGAGARHKEPEPKGYLSDGYEWLERMDQTSLNVTEAVVDAYMAIYEAQMPNVYELDPWRYNWCVDNESEDAVWLSDEELGVERHIKKRYTHDEIMEMQGARQRVLQVDGGARDGRHAHSVKHSTGAGVYTAGDSEQPDADNLVPESEEIESESDTEADLSTNSWEGTSSSL